MRMGRRIFTAIIAKSNIGNFLAGKGGNWTVFCCVFLAVATLTPFVLAAVSTSMLMLGHAHRIYNIREMSGPLDWPDLTGAYIDAQMRPGAIVYTGSSFTLGHPWAAALSFPAVAGRKMDVPALNMGVLGAGLAGSETFVVCELQRRGLRVHAIVVEIPLINEVDHLTKRPRHAATPKTYCKPSPLRPLFLTALMDNHALTWLRRWQDSERATVERNDFGPVPEGYFAASGDFERVKQMLSDRIRTVLEFAGQQTDNVFAFVTPVYLPGIKAAGRDDNAVAAQFEFTQAVCIAVLGSNCIQTRQMSEHKYLFYNLTHLNISGHAEMGDLVATAIATNAKK